MSELTGKPAATSAQQPESAFVQLATVLQGAQPLAEKGVNDSFRGQLLLPDQTTKSAIIKDLDPRELANELMAAALAYAAGMPVPGAYLATVSPDVMTAKKGPALADGSQLVFGSIDAMTPPVAQLYQGKDEKVRKKVCERLAEWEHIGGLYGFDSWVANTDRHHKNLLFSGDKEVWLIDHGYCFTGPKWKATNLDPSKAYRNKLKDWLTPVMPDKRRTSVSGAAAELADKVNELDLKKVGELNHVLDVLDKDDFSALVSFLTQRNTHVPGLAASALNVVA